MFSDPGVVCEHQQWEKAFTPVYSSSPPGLFSNFSCCIESHVAERDCESVITAIADQLAADVWADVTPYIVGEPQQHPKTSYGRRNYQRAKIGTANPKKRTVKMDVITLAGPRVRGVNFRPELRPRVPTEHRRSRSLT